MRYLELFHRIIKRWYGKLAEWRIISKDQQGPEKYSFSFHQKNLIQRQNTPQSFSLHNASLPFEIIARKSSNKAAILITSPSCMSSSSLTLSGNKHGCSRASLRVRFSQTVRRDTQQFEQVDCVRGKLIETESKCICCLKQSKSENRCTEFIS